MEKEKKGTSVLRIKNIEIFDIDWFCFIVDRAHLEKELQEDKMQEKIIKAECELKENRNNKITWNRLLCGYIIPRKTIKYQEVKKKLEIIIQFYNCFENYIKRNKAC